MKAIALLLFLFALGSAMQVDVSIDYIGSILKLD